ncbi:Inositolphosphorylceramide-B hydroxylase [Neoconidiobolus thromboides FSU 785]|nr:Inositolphosphorylceramide-B hydroxylase [Neoconidiobolus thromboides FSU 785]
MISVLQAYTPEEVKLHNTTHSCWVIYKGKIYDVTEFAEDHPGGEDLILKYGGKDITNIFNDPISYRHSENAHNILDEFLIGEVREAGGKADSFAHKGNHTYTDISKDLKEEKFLDLNGALFEQMFFNNFSKEFYLKQVHTPRYTKESPIFFSSPFLEMLTRTAWYVIPTFWLPVCFYFLLLSYNLNTANNIMGYCFIGGIFIFTLIEYSIHRFLFHLDDLVPDTPFFLFVHFLLHGVHHYIPMDRMRLVLPPVLGVALGLPLYKIVSLILNDSSLDGIRFALLSGGVFGYICYDLVHYYVHHGHIFFNYFKEMKSYHMAHHHSNYQVGFGITSKVWDYVFDTVLTDESPNIIHVVKRDN